MDLSDYWRVVRRWGILIIAGTVVAALAGYGMALWHRGTADPATLASLRANLDILQANYLAAAGRYTAVRDNPVPVATVMAGSVVVLKAHRSSPMQAMLPAAGL